MCELNMSQTDACKMCADKCMLIHKKNRNPSPIVSSCVKVMIDNCFFNFLPLPPRFAPIVDSLVGRETWVEDSSGRKSPLTISDVKGRLGFGDGWRDFSKNHEIKIGDILIINCVLDSHFIVQIYDRSGCENLNLAPRNSTTPKKRSRKKSDLVGREHGSASCKAKEISEEPSLMLVNRDTPTKGEEERVTLCDNVLASKSSTKNKPVGEGDHVQNKIGSSNAKDALKNKVDGNMDNSDGKVRYKSNTESGRMSISSSYSSKIIHSETAKKLEIPEKLDNGFAQCEDMLSDIDAACEGLLGNPLDATLGDMNENGNYEYHCTPVIDHKSNIVGKNENGVSTMKCEGLQSDRVKENSVPLPENSHLHLTGSNVTKYNINEMHTPAQPTAQITTSDCQIDGNKGKSILNEPDSTVGGSQITSICYTPLKGTPGNKGKSILEEPASAVGGSQITSICYTPLKGTPGVGVKVVKTEPKEFNLAEVGMSSRDATRSELGPTITSSGEYLKVVKDEPVEHAFQAAYLVTPNSESFFEIRRRLPTPSKAEVEVKVVVLRDSSGRRWPVLYHDRCGLKGFGAGWGSFVKANGIKCGDECVFTLEDRFESLYRVQVMKK